MTWIKLRNNFADDDRWMDAGANAFAVHVAALCYCDQQLTDGTISAARARRVALPVHPAEAEEAIEKLVELRFWTRTEDGYQIVDYLEEQVGISREDTLRTRARWAEDKRWRRQHKVGDHALCPPGKCPAKGSETDVPQGSTKNASHKDNADVQGGQRQSPARKRAMSRPLDTTRPDPTGGKGRGGSGKGGSASGKPARSARRAPSGSPPDDGQANATRGTGDTPKQPPKPAPKPPCPHDFPGGLWFADASNNELACPKCSALVPNPDTHHFQEWAEGMPWLNDYLADQIPTCADPTNEEAAEKVARIVFHHITRTQSYHGVQPRQQRLFRRIKAYAVDHAEPGRVKELTNTHNPKEKT